MFSSTKLLPLIALVLVLLALGINVAAQPAVSPTTDPTNGYPLWYQDARVPGIRVQPCLDVAEPCVLLGDAGFNPANPVVFPTNFPGEFFYTVADSDKLDTPGCPASGIAPGPVKWRGAVEGSFLTGVVDPGQQSTFARTKIVANGLCPNTNYIFTTPYGADLVTTNAAGQVVANKKGATIDIGCAAAPCDFSVATTSRVFGGFVQWDPAVAPPAPAGFLGDAAGAAGTPHAVVGPFANFFSISDAGGTLLSGCVDANGVSGPCRVDLFTVSGKIAGPLMGAPSTINFGGQAQGTPSAPMTVTITNVYPAAITVSGISFTGANAADFAPFSDLCTGVPLAQDASCSIAVTFTPSLIAVENATLAVAHNGPFRSPLNVALTGTGTAAGAAPVVSLSAASLAFGPQRVRTTSANKTVTVTNTGNAPLTATVTIVDDPNSNPAADQFSKVTDTCSGQSIAAGLSCAVSVQFVPTVAQASTALLNFADNAANTPQQVTLTGTGTGGVAAVSTTKDPYGYPDWYQDENGVQVQPCLDPAPAPCVLLGDAGFNPALPLALPGNFPVEFFYFVADSDKMDVPGCPAPLTPPAKVTYRAALEGSFLTGVAELGQQSAFTRTKIVVPPGGLCPNTTYAFTHPYGTDLITTDGAGGVVANKKGATIDTGCAAAPCDFSIALSSRVMGGLLKWDPNFGAPPAGFLGDAGAAVGTPHEVIGSPYIDPVTGTPANFLRISDPATGAIMTGCIDALGAAGPCLVSKFTVSGKLATPVQTSQVSTPGPVTFAPTNIGTTSAAQTVTLTNADPVNSVTIGAASVLTTPGGLASPDFSMGADTCSGATLAPAPPAPAAPATCTIDVVFNPTTAGLLAGALVVPHNGLNSPAEVPLSGTGVVPNQPPVAVDDSTTTSTGTPVNIAVLANDSDPDGNLPLTVGSLTQPTNGTAVLELNNTITYTSNGTFTGTDSFTYQAADSLGALSNIATVTVTVNAPAPIATTTSIGAPTVTYPANGLVTVTVGAAAGTPTGNVELFVDGSATPITQALLGGSTTFTLTGLAAGVHTLSANYAAQGSFLASSNTGTLTVNPAATTTAISVPAATFYPSNASITVTVSSLAGTPAGNVSLSVDGVAQTPQALVAGSATFTLTSPAAGSHSLVATYAAQGNFAASSKTGTLTVNGAATTTSIVAPTVTFPSNALVTVTVSSAAGTPTGNVSLSVDGVAQTPQALVGGSATFTLINPAGGTHPLSASYAPQGNFAGSTASGTLTVNTTEAITATATASRNRLRTAASWTINGTTNILTAHTMTVTLTRTGEPIGLPATTKANGSWKVSAGKSPIVPVPGDTITVTSSLGTTKIFSVTVK